MESILTLTGRDNIWNSVFESLREYPFGTGYASDQYLLLDEYNLGILGEVSSAHSIYLESFIAAKYLGLGALIFSFIYWFRFSEKNFNQNLSRILQTLIFYSIICGFTNSGFGGSNINNPWILFWVVYGYSSIVNTANGK